MNRVSIGMPVYNGERYIAETIDSILAQTFEDYELIICDNASTDRTEEICRAYMDRDNRIRYIRNAQNLGARMNYKLAFELSLGEYFRWSNSDDLFAPESLARCVEVLDQESSVILTYPKTKFIDAYGRVFSNYEDGLDLRSPRASERFTQLMQRLKFVNVIYGLMRADILRQTGLLRNFPGGDIALVVELSFYGKFWEIPEFLFFRRFHPGALSSQTKNVYANQEFFDPKTKGQIPFREWKHLLNYCESVMRAPLDKLEKMHLTYLLIRMGIWKRRRLMGELTQGFNQVRTNLTSKGLMGISKAWQGQFFTENLDSETDHDEPATGEK